MEKKSFFQKLNKNNQGLTLVEVLIALGIMSIVCTMVFGFMSSSSKMFSKSNAEVNIQTEAQSAANAIKELILDCQVSVDYFDTQSDPTRVFKDYGTEYKDVLLVNNNDEQFLVYQNPAKSDELLYLSRKRNTTTGKFDIPFDASEAEVLAEYVSKFKVDTARFNDTKMIDFSFVYSLRGKEYKGVYQVRMRNDVIIDSKTDYDTPNESRVTQVIVAPAACTIAPDTSGSLEIVTPQAFSANVRTTGTVSQEKIWSLEENFPWCTIDEESGLMKVTGEPTEASYKVVATSKANEAIKGSATVKVKKLISLAVKPITGLTGTVDGYDSANMNSRVLYAADIDGWNLTDTDKSVIWKLEYKTDYDFSTPYTVLTEYDPVSRQYVNYNTNLGYITAAGLVNIGKNAANDVEFKITATATFPNYGKPLTYQSNYAILRVKNATAEFNDDFIREFNINIKNYFLSGKAALDDNISSDITEITNFVSASYDDGTGRRTLDVDLNKLSEGILCIDSSSIRNVNAEDNLKYYKEFMVYVTIQDQNGEAKEIKVKFPEVTVSKGTPELKYIVISKGSTLDIPFKYSGMNVTDAGQIGIYIGGEKVSQSGSSSVNQYLISYLQTTGAGGTSALGTKDNYVDTQTVRLAANNTSKYYPKEKSGLVIALDDFYQVSDKKVESYKAYDVYVANVEGQQLFIPVPGTTGNKDNPYVDGFPTDVKEEAQTYKMGPTQTEVKLYTKNGKTYMEYSAKTYVYDSMYSYWKLK